MADTSLTFKVVRVENLDVRCSLCFFSVKFIYYFGLFFGSEDTCLILIVLDNWFS